MSQITWRNINSPDLTGVAQIQQQGAANLQGATDTLMGLANQQRDMNIKQEVDQKRSNTFKLLETIRTVPSLQEYEGLSLNNLLGSVGGQADEQVVYNALMNRDDEFYNDVLKEKQLESTELSISGKTIGNKAAQLAMDNSLKNMTKDNRLKGIEDAAINYGMSVYTDAPSTSERDVTELATESGKKLGYKGNELQQYVNKVSSTTGNMRKIRADESPYTQLAETTVQTAYDTQVTNAAYMRDRVFTDNPVDPQWDVVTSIKSRADVVTPLLAEYSDKVYTLTGGQGVSLSKELDEIMDKFLVDNDMSEIPPTVLEASLKMGSGLWVNPEALGQNKLDTSRLYRTLEKFNQMYKMNDVYKANRNEATANYNTAIESATTRRSTEMLEIFKAKGNMNKLKDMVQSYNR